MYMALLTLYTTKLFATIRSRYLLLQNCRQSQKIETTSRGASFIMYKALSTYDGIFHPDEYIMAPIFTSLI